MRFFVLSSLMICAVLTGCRKHRVIVPPPPPPSSTSGNTLVAGTVIKGGGSWTYVSGSVRHVMSTTTRSSPPGVEWHYMIMDRGGGSGDSSTLLLTAPSDPWFIYVEEPGHLWFFNGAGHLVERQWNGGSEEPTDMITNGALTGDRSLVPPELVPLLPDNLQKLFPARSNQPRPSI